MGEIFYQFMLWIGAPLVGALITTGIYVISCVAKDYIDEKWNG